MTTKKLTDLTELTATATGDFTHVVDVSDTTDDPAGSSRKVKISNLLPDSGATAGSYGDATHVGAFTVNAKGQITAVSSVAITGGGGGGSTAGALTYATTVTWDASAIQLARLTLTGNATLALPTNLTAGRYSLRVTQDATGGRTLAYAAGFKWPNATPPVLSTGANAVDVLDFISFDGTTLVSAAQYGYA